MKIFRIYTVNGECKEVYAKSGRALMKEHKNEIDVYKDVTRDYITEEKMRDAIAHAVSEICPAFADEITSEIVEKVFKAKENKE